jgi:hypothetical protein
MAVIDQSGVLVVPRHTVPKGLLKRLITDAAIIVNKSQQEVMEILLETFTFLFLFLFYFLLIKNHSHLAQFTFNH